MQFIVYVTFKSLQSWKTVGGTIVSWGPSAFRNEINWRPCTCFLSVQRQPMEKSPSKERWSFPRLEEISSPPLSSKWAGLIRAKVLFPSFSDRIGLFFFHFFLKQLSKAHPLHAQTLWPSRSWLTSEPIIPHKHSSPQPHPWEKNEKQKAHVSKVALKSQGK